MWTVTSHLPQDVQHTPSEITREFYVSLCLLQCQHMPIMSRYSYSRHTTTRQPINVTNTTRVLRRVYVVSHELCFSPHPISDCTHLPTTRTVSALEEQYEHLLFPGLLIILSGLGVKDFNQDSWLFRGVCSLKV